MNTGDEDDDSFDREIASEGLNAITWLAVARTTNNASTLCAACMSATWSSVHGVTTSYISVEFGTVK
jgi:hypothetical protein